MASMRLSNSLDFKIDISSLTVLKFEINTTRYRYQVDVHISLREWTILIHIFYSVIFNWGEGNINFLTISGDSKQFSLKTNNIFLPKILLFL